MAAKPVFVRDATGLVRRLGFLDQVLISISMLNVSGFVWSALAAPYYFPGANLVLVYTLGAVPAFGIAILYGIFSAAIPRSGGDYVWTGRVLGPRIATVLAIVILVSSNLAYLAANYWFAVGLGFAQLFVSLGLVTGNQGLVLWGMTFATPSVGFLVSLILIVIVLLIGLFGVDVFRRILRYSYAFYIFSLVLFAIGIIVAGSGSYANNFNAVLGRYNVTYSQIQSAVSSNPQIATTSNLNSTLLAVVPLGFFAYAGFNFNTYLAGETKNASNTIPRGLILSVIFGGVGICSLVYLSYAFLGGAFIGGMSYLFNSGQLSSFPVQPTINFLISLAIPAWLGFLINLNVTIGFILFCVSFTISCSRLFFALAFDRVLPSRVADVSDRLHSPYVSLMIISVLSVLCTYVWWYTGWAASYLNGGLAINVAYIIPGVAGMLFPIVKKDLFKQTVGSLSGWLSAEIAGIPVISLAGLVVTGAWLFGIYSLVNPGFSFTYLGPALPYAIALTIGLVVVGLVIFETSRAYHKRKDGFDITMAYAEIPPE